MLFKCSLCCDGDTGVKDETPDRVIQEVDTTFDSKPKIGLTDQLLQLV